jgi:hypothetical protein
MKVAFVVLFIIGFICCCSNGIVLSSGINVPDVLIDSNTSNTVNTTYGWTGSNAHSITALLTKIGNVVFCQFQDNTAISPLDETNFIAVVFLIPYGWRPVTGIAASGVTFVAPNSLVGATYIVDAAGNLFVYRIAWNGIFNVNYAWPAYTNMRLAYGATATMLTWTIA